MNSIFRRRVAKFCESFSRKRKRRCSILSDAYNYNIDAYMFATYSVKVERIMLFVKIVNQYFEKKKRKKKECFSAALVPFLTTVL